jgi:hypothetical protein
MAAPALRSVTSFTDDEQTNLLGATLGVGFGLSPSLYQVLLLLLLLLLPPPLLLLLLLPPPPPPPPPLTLLTQSLSSDFHRGLHVIDAPWTPPALPPLGVCTPKNRTEKP